MISKKSSKISIAIGLFVLVVFAAGLGAFFSGSMPWGGQSSQHGQSTNQGENQRQDVDSKHHGKADDDVVVFSIDDNEEESSEDIEIPKSQKGGEAVVTTYTSKGGITLSSMRAFVLADGWVAIPRKRLMAVKHIQIATSNSSSAEELEFIGGVYTKPNTLGLWRFEGGQGGLELKAYDHREELYWREWGVSKLKKVQAPAGRVDGDFLKFPYAKGKDGLFLQKSHAVGFSIAALKNEESISGKKATDLDGAWLWLGEDQSELTGKISLDKLYNSTVSGGRTEALVNFLESQARKNIDNFQKVELFFAACQFPQLLADHLIPPSLRLRSCLNTAKALLAPYIEITSYSEALTDLLSLGNLEICADPDLYLVAASLQISAGDPQLAVTQLISLGSSRLEISHVQNEKSKQLIKKAYATWMRSEMQENRLQRAWQVYFEANEECGEILELELRRAELELADLDWRAAEESMRGLQIESRYQDYAALLRAKISELKGQEGKIVIRFAPSSNVIRTTAQLETSVEQNFIVDTGASKTTIPYASARALGIKISRQTPRVRVNTASGIVDAPMVKLESISLRGQAVTDIEVIVLDLPGDSSYGLLGLNFLNAFSMSLDNEKGILTLEPK